jgi:hypothetical protein
MGNAATMRLFLTVCLLSEYDNEGGLVTLAATLARERIAMAGGSTKKSQED